MLVPIKCVCHLRSGSAVSNLPGVGSCCCSVVAGSAWSFIIRPPVARSGKTKRAETIGHVKVSIGLWNSPCRADRPCGPCVHDGFGWPVSSLFTWQELVLVVPSRRRRRRRRLHGRTCGDRGRPSGHGGVADLLLRRTCQRQFG